MPTDDVGNEIIHVTILMNFLIHELNKELGGVTGDGGAGQRANL